MRDQMNPVILLKMRVFLYRFLSHRSIFMLQERYGADNTLTGVDIQDKTFFFCKVLFVDGE